MVERYLPIVSMIVRIYASVSCFNGEQSKNNVVIEGRVWRRDRRRLATHIGSIPAPRLTKLSISLRSANWYQTCLRGYQHWLDTSPLRTNRMCLITLKIPDGDAIFMQYKCPSLGCHSNVTSVYCCCDTDMCNTIAFYELNSPATYHGQYIGHCLILIIIIAKLLTLLINNYGSHLKLFDRNPSFEDRIHLDLTEFTIQPKLSSSETNNVIERISSSNVDLTTICLTSVKMRAVLTYSTSDRITHREPKKQAILSNVNSESTMEDILFAVIRLGPCEIEWCSDIVLAILRRAYDLLKTEPTLLELSVPITIYGDLHGQYSDIWRWFRVNGWPPDTRCLFLGDYVDRGRHSTEVLMFVLLLKIVMPKAVYLCRGNHEDPPVNKTYNFRGEIKTRFPKAYRKLLHKLGKVYSVMPIACLISQQILCMHGGLSPNVHTIDEIAALRKPIVTKHKQDRHIDFLWSDPHIDVWTFEPNIRRDPSGAGVGHLFGPIQIRNFIKRNHLSLIVRGHQPPMSGYERIGKHLITIFSTPAYRIEENVGNMGASLVIDEDGKMDIIRMQVGEQLKLKRQRYKMDKGDRYKDCGKPRRKKVASSEDDKYS